MEAERVSAVIAESILRQGEASRNPLNRSPTRAMRIEISRIRLTVKKHPPATV
jgi:hypothetical protein